MVKKGDVVFVASYATTFVLLGIWLLALALRYVDTFGKMFLLFLASEGLAIVCFSLVRTSRAPRGSTFGIGVGAMLLVFGIVAYLIVGEALTLVAGIALVFIVAGAMLLLLYLARSKLEIED